MLELAHNHIMYTNAVAYKAILHNCVLTILCNSLLVYVYVGQVSSYFLLFSIHLTYTHDSLKFKPSIRIGKEINLSDFEHGDVVMVWV